MISKSQFVSFIEKYYLNASVEASILSINDKTMVTRFMLPSSDLIGKIELNNFDLEDCEIGIYYTGALLKMLSILDEDINIIPKNGRGENAEKIISLKIEDKKGKYINYATSDLDLIERVVKKSKISEFDLNINLNQELVDDILKASSAIETLAITFLEKKGKIYIVFGYSKNNSNQIKFEVDCDYKNEFEPISFSLVNLKNILIANKKFEKSEMVISFKGMMKLTFEDKNSNSEYFLVKLQENE